MSFNPNNMDVEGPSMPDAYNISLWSIAFSKPKITQNTKWQPMFFFKVEARGHICLSRVGWCSTKIKEMNWFQFWDFFGWVQFWLFRRFFSLHLFLYELVPSDKLRVWYGICTCKIMQKITLLEKLCFPAFAFSLQLVFETNIAPLNHRQWNQMDH